MEFHCNPSILFTFPLRFLLNMENWVNTLWKSFHFKAKLSMEDCRNLFYEIVFCFLLEWPIPPPVEGPCTLSWYLLRESIKSILKSLITRLLTQHQINAVVQPLFVAPFQSKTVLFRLCRSDIDCIQGLCYMICYCVPIICFKKYQ